MATRSRPGSVFRAALLALPMLGCARKPPEPTPLDTSRSAPSSAPRAEPSAKTHPDPFQERTAERRSMVRQLEREGIRDSRVLAALGRVPRHAFVAEAVRDLAYSDRALPIGSGQTISQPFVVAFMSEAAQARASDKCLEIGTGSGYQAAVLAELCQRTWSIEYLPELAENAKRTLLELGYEKRVEVRTGDGYAGMPEAAPFDVILVTAAPEKVPEPLLDQLAVGGRLIVPVGPQTDHQKLERWVRTGPGAFTREALLDVRFVPFLGDGGR